LSGEDAVFTKHSGMEGAVAAVAEQLKRLKDRFPESDTMILIPDADITYNEIVRTMDCGRAYQSETLFPNVVLSGSLG
jgi:hypothetical protein